MAASSTVLDARGLTKAFDGRAVLHGVDLQVGAGELLSVMGPSGSGKSTLLYAACGMDTPTSGTVLFDGHDLAALRPKQLARVRLTRMGFIFQHVHLLKNLSLLDNVVLPAYLAGSAPREALVDRAMGLMRRTGVAELADRDVSEASGGQLQRVGICRALINEPTILLGDEPTGALDSTATAEVMNILTELNAEGMTVMLVTHDVTVAAHTDRVLYMIDGHIVGQRCLGRRRVGQDLDQRQAEVAEWAGEQDRVRAGGRAAPETAPEIRRDDVTGPR